MKKMHFCAAIALLGLLLPALACVRSKTETFVPLMRTAKEQYEYAVNFKSQRHAELVTDEKRYKEARAVILDAFARVPQHFPDDQVYTPIAKLDIIDIRCGFDTGRSQLGEREQQKTFRRAIADLAELAQQYPDNQFVQAKTLYDRGMCHKALGEFGLMQECFKAVRDRWLNDANPIMKELAMKADYFYRQTYVEKS